MRRDPTATVVGITAWVLADGRVATIWRVRCPLCRGFHNHWPGGTRHLRQAPCTPCSGLYIEPPTPRIVEKRNVIDQRPETEAARRRREYIEACRTVHPADHDAGGADDAVDRDD